MSFPSKVDKRTFSAEEKAPEPRTSEAKAQGGTIPRISLSAHCMAIGTEKNELRVDHDGKTDPGLPRPPYAVCKSLATSDRYAARSSPGSRAVP